MIYELPQT